MRVVLLPCVWLPCLLPVACQGAPPCAEVPVLERFEIRYSGRMDGSAFQAEPVAFTPVPSDGDQVVVHGQVLRLPLAVAERLLSDATVPGGGERFGFGLDCARVSSAELKRSLDALLATHVATEVAAPRVPCVLGRSAYVAQLAQCSYISAFQLKALPQALVADPVVGVATEGYHLMVRPEVAGDRLALDVSLHATELVRPMATATSPLVQGTVPVEIQVPVFFHQELSARPCLRPGEAACVTCPQSPDRTEVVLLVLECERERAALPALAVSR